MQNSNKESHLPNNPYLPVDFLTVSGLGVDPTVGFEKMLASFDYGIQASGVMSIDPQTGQQYGDLTHYSVFVSDGTAEVIASINLDTRDEFDVPTQSLNFNVPWKVRFSGNRGADGVDSGNSLVYEFTIQSPAALRSSGANSTTVPPSSIWSNIELTFFLESTTDPNFTLFPENGVLVKRDNTLDFNPYSTTKQLTAGSDYVFKVTVKRKKGLDAGFSSESITGDISATSPSFPFGTGTLPKELYSDFTLDTATAGAKTGTLNYGVTNGGVLNFTIFKTSFTVV